MKLIRTFALSLFTAVAALAQFEGKITWSMKAEMTDPAMAARMEAANQRMNSPETQAKMAEARKRMESPEFKAMMEANPQMKAMMERQMAAMTPKTGATAGAPGGGMFPTGMTVSIKGTDTLTSTEGGMVSRDVLSLGEKSEVYMLDRAGKTYMKMPTSASTPGDTAKPTYQVTKSSETQTILGYTCTRYDVTMQSAKTPAAGEGMHFTLWVAPDVKGLNASQFRSMRLGDQADAGFLSQINGMPLKMDVTQPKVHMTMEVTGINAESLPASVFTLPADFTETSFPYGKR